MRGQAHGRHELSRLSSLYRLKAPLWEGDGFLLLYKKMEAVIKNALSYEEILAFIKGVRWGMKNTHKKELICMTLEMV